MVDTVTLTGDMLNDPLPSPPPPGDIGGFSVFADLPGAGPAPDLPPAQGGGGSGRRRLQSDASGDGVRAGAKAGGRSLQDFNTVHNPPARTPHSPPESTSNAPFATRSRRRRTSARWAAAQGSMRIGT